jgi:hypothetical protein
MARTAAVRIADPDHRAERALHADFAHAGQRVEIGHGRNALINDWQRAALLGFGAQTVHHRAFQRLPRLLAELRLVPPVATKLHLLTPWRMTSILQRPHDVIDACPSNAPRTNRTEHADRMESPPQRPQPTIDRPKAS